MTNGHQQRIAVLIDTENISAEQAGPLFHRIDAIGRTIVRRAFADFTTVGSAWLTVARRYGIDTIQVGSPGKGKNAADIRLTIDAIDLLRTFDIDVFCLVTSDGDFAPLATYLRGAGCQVIAFGAVPASQAFREACSSFHELRSPATVAPATPALHQIAALALVPKTAATPVAKPAPHADFGKLVARATTSMKVSPEGWMNLSELGTVLRRDNPGFALADYGSGTLGKALAKVPNAIVEGMRFKFLKKLQIV